VMTPLVASFDGVSIAAVTANDRFSTFRTLYSLNHRIPGNST
jgi:hypothetical protein